MTGLSGHSRAGVLLTFIAVFLVMASLLMSWYHVYGERTTVTEYWLDHYDAQWSSYEPYYDSEVGVVMDWLKGFAVVWFFVALVFVGQVISDQRSGVLSGVGLAAVGPAMLTYFALAFTEAEGSEYTIRFFSSITIDGTEYTSSPTGGFTVVVIASAVQAIAVFLHLWSALPGARVVKLEPYEAPVAPKDQK
jgi:hypothetical protein